MVIGKKGWWSKWREWRECSRWSAEEEEEKRNRMVAKRRTKGILDISSSSGFFPRACCCCCCCCCYIQNLTVGRKESVKKPLVWSMKLKREKVWSLRGNSKYRCHNCLNLF